MMNFLRKKQMMQLRINELQEKYDKLDAAHAEFIKETERLRNRAYLMDIQREGRTIKFLFARNMEIYQIETMGMWSDNLSAWKKDLLE